jgi:hypothetical protein
MVCSATEELASVRLREKQLREGEETTMNRLLSILNGHAEDRSPVVCLAGGFDACLRDAD